jgi:hypothetical protein
MNDNAQKQAVHELYSVTNLKGQNTLSTKNQLKIIIWLKPFP